jgi:phospholipase C
MGPAINDKIKHVVVLMFENRSFDHIFGALPNVNGVLGDDGKVKPELYNTLKPTKKPEPPFILPHNPPPVVPTPITINTQSLSSFNHDFWDGMMPDLFGPGTTGVVDGTPLGAPVTYPSTNSGFLKVTKDYGQPDYPAVMNYFELGQLGAHHTLAQEFVVCDNWFCDMPGHTEVNRLFMHCAQSDGFDQQNNDPNTCFTIFDLIHAQAVPGAPWTWKMYVPTIDGISGQLDSSFLNGNIQTSPFTNTPIAQFAEDAQNRTLPFYSFLMPWFPPGYSPYNDPSMHPNSWVQAGENYLAAVYNTLLNSPSWEDTLLIVTYDENGGMYDHVLPPTAIPPIEGVGSVYETNKIKNPPNPPILMTSSFDFSLLGPRVPAMLISPWLSKGSVDSSQYQNTSILRFIEDLIIPPSPTNSPLFLTQRDRYANSIARAFEQFGLQDMRTDCPQIPIQFPDFAYGTGSLASPGVGAVNTYTHSPTDPPTDHGLDITKMYVKRQPGHADSGKPITREFLTNADLQRYSAQRHQAAHWYFKGDHLKASIQIIEKAPGQWIWELKNEQGTVLAIPQNYYVTKEAAQLELDRVRFLFHELCCTS